MALKAVGIEDDNTFPGRFGTALTQKISDVVDPELAQKLENLTVGTTTTGNAGTNASVSITGTAPTQTINFTIPRGDKGDKGDKGDPGNVGTAGRGITSIADTDGDGTATVTYTDNSTSSLVLPSAGPESNPVIKYFLQAVRDRNQAPVKIVMDGSSTANGGVTSIPSKKLVDRLSALTTLNPVRIDLTNPNATDIQWYETAVGGTQANNYITAEEITQLASVQPTLMLHLIGSNDYFSQKAPSTFLSQLRTVLNDIKAATPNTRHLFVTHQPRNDLNAATATYKFHQYVDQMWVLANENPGLVSVIDLSKKFQRIGIPGNDVWGMVAGDNVHLGDWSSKVYAYWLAEALGIPTPPDNVERYTATDYASSTARTSSFIHHLITIPPRPYPREGLYHGIYYVRNDGGTAVNEIRCYKSATLSIGPNSTVKNMFYRIPPLTVGQATNVSTTNQIYVAPHETLVVEGYVQIGGGNTFYVSGNSSYSDGTVILSPA